MKAFIVVALACVAGVLATPSMLPETQVKLEAIRKLGGYVTPAGMLPELNQTTVLPPDLNVTLDLTNLQGYFALYDGVAYDLDQLSDTLKLNVLALTVKGIVTVPTATIQGKPECNGLILINSGLHHITGKGDLDLTVNAVTVDIYVKLRLTVQLRVQISEIRATPVVGSCSGSAEGIKSDEVQIDVTDICDGITQKVEEEWANHGPAVIEDIKQIGNDFLKDKTLQDLIDLIGGGGK